MGRNVMWDSDNTDLGIGAGGLREARGGRCGADGGVGGGGAEAGTEIEIDGAVRAGGGSRKPAPRSGELGLGDQMSMPPRLGPSRSAGLPPREFVNISPQDVISDRCGCAVAGHFPLSFDSPAR